MLVLVTQVALASLSYASRRNSAYGGVAWCLGLALGEGILVEGVGFEPTKTAKPCQFSRLVQSTTLPALQRRDCNRFSDPVGKRASIFQKNRLQIVQKSPAQQGRRDALVIARYESTLFGNT